MIQEILSAALNSGLWAALFCMLFFYQLRDSKEREKKYVATIDSLADSLKLLHGVDEKCREIIADCNQIKDDCTEIKVQCTEIKRGINDEF